MRWQSAWLVACSVVLLAGCGSPSTHPKATPAKIPAALAQQLAADADAVAALSGCAAYNAAVKFRSEVIANVSRIPARYQEPLTSAANELTARVPDCAAPQPGDEGPSPDEKHGHKKKPHKHDEGD
jgi:hypothetical protein